MMMALAMVEGSQKLPKNPRFLCLHGFRNSAKILQTSVQKWPQAVLQNLELVYLDAPYPAEGPSGVEGIFDPPYYEWFQANQDYTEYKNFEECIAYIEDYMVKNGPFDGILGFSQGAILASVLPGIQAQGLVLTKVPKIKFLIIISGAKFGGKKLGMPPLAAEAYSPPTQCLSLQFIGETDVLYSEGVDLFDCFVEPTVIHHPEGHTVPKLDEESLATTLRFIEKITRDCTALVNSADDGCNSARMVGTE